MVDFERIKSTIENAKNIIIVINKKADKDTISAGLSVFFALKNKNVFIPKEKNPTELFNFLSEDASKKIIISLKNEISEISYEKNNGGIDLFLIPKNIEEVNPENFSCKLISEEKSFLSSPPIFDLIIVFGIQSFNYLESCFKENIDSIYNCTIINIDNNPQNEQYGEINLVKENSSISENTSTLLKNVQEKISNKSAGFLLMGILSNLKEKKTNQTIPIIKWLISEGGNLYFKNNKSELKRKLILLENTIKNLSYLEKENLYISSLSENDFKNSNTSSADLSFIIDKMKNYFSIPSFMLLWEGRSSLPSIKVVFYSSKENIVNKIKNSYQGSYKGQGGIFITKKKDLPSAKKELISIFNYG
jgi:nanoRNase/pAp phosphatase (c-di-AMP/oligoRNAs hydrolase)